MSAISSGVMPGVPPGASPASARRPARRPQARRTDGVSPARAVAGHALVAERGSRTSPVRGIEQPEAARDLLRHEPVAAAPSCEPHRARHACSMWVSTGMTRAAGGMRVHSPKSGGSRRIIQRR